MLSQVIGAAWLQHRSKALHTTAKAAAKPVLPCVDFIVLDDDDDESNQ
jgi:hypothetical protein